MRSRDAQCKTEESQAQAQPNAANKMRRPVKSVRSDTQTELAIQESLTFTQKDKFSYFYSPKFYFGHCFLFLF